MDFTATGIATAEAVGASMVAMAKRTSRRASVAVFILLALIIAAVMSTPGAGASLKAYADDASSIIGVMSVDGRDSNFSSYKDLREELT